MSNNVQFQGEQRATRPSFKKKGLAAWLMRHSGGLIKNEKQAQIALIAILIAAVVLTLIIVTATGPDTVPVNPPSAI